MAVDETKHLLCESPRASLRLAMASQLLHGLPSESPLLIVASSHASAQWLVAEALGQLGGARFAWHKRTLASLTEELALPALAAQQRVMLRGLGMLGLCARVVEEQAHRRALGRYTRIAQRPGFARALAHTLAELRLSGTTVAELAQQDLELSRMLEGYEAALDSLSLADPALCLRLAAQAAAGASRFRGFPLLFVDVALAHRLHGELVAALCGAASRVVTTIARGDERSEAYFRLALGDALSIRRSEPQDERDLSRLQARLFTPSAAPLDSATKPGGVYIVSCPGESREAVEVARAVLEAAQRGVPFDRMAIALRAVEGYRAVVEEALARAQIPAHFAEGVRRPLPEGRALLLLLECARDNLSAELFAEYLSLAVFPRPEDPASRPGRWERLLREAAVGQGRERWLARLARYQQDLAEQGEGAERDESRPAKVHADHDSLQALQAFVVPLLEQLQGLAMPRTWGDYLARLEQLASHTLAAPDAVVEVLRELAPLAELGPVRVGDVHRVLATRLGSVVLRSSGHGAGKVFVGAPEDLRGRSFDLVFVMGLAEQLFPPRLSEDPLLPDRVRSRLSPELPLLEERAALERLALRVCVGAAREQLVLTYPRFDLEHGRPRVPSFYGLEVLHAMDGSLPAFDELARRATQGAATRMGFPAPERPEQAIDDAEFDLAVLGELLRQPAQKRAGGLRYLLSQHVHLARALRFRARRWSLARFSAADGFVAQDDAGRALLAAHQLSARAYSPSALAQVAACPYRFYLHAICGVRERHLLSSESAPDARERGVLMHRVQYALLSELRARQQLPVTSATLEAAQVLLGVHFVRLAAEQRERCDPGAARVLDESLGGLRNDLEEWLRIAARAPEWVPLHFELAFGLAHPQGEVDERSVSEPVQIGALKLSGMIDLVERHAQPDEQGRVRLRVTDHKSSLPEERAAGAARPVVVGGKLLQPVLYALAAERLFADARVESGRLYFCTSRADFEELPVPLDDGARAVVTELVSAIDGLLKAGFLPAVPRKDECGRCPYLVVCGPYEEKERVPVVKAKDMARLAQLFRLRNLP